MFNIISSGLIVYTGGICFLAATVAINQIIRDKVTKLVSEYLER
jgi:hypothetical protein